MYKWSEGPMSGVKSEETRQRPRDRGILPNTPKYRKEKNVHEPSHGRDDPQKQKYWEETKSRGTCLQIKGSEHPQTIFPVWDGGGKCKFNCRTVRRKLEDYVRIPRNFHLQLWQGSFFWNPAQISVTCLPTSNLKDK